MESVKEISYIILAIIVLAFAVNIHALQNPGFQYSFIFINLIIVALIVAINIIGKEIAAYYYEARIENKIWMWQRYGFKREQYLKTPLPAGIIVPFFMSLISYGYIIWLAALEFDVFSTSARASKRHGKFRFTEMTDIHIGLIASAGIVLSLISAVIGYIFSGFIPPALDFAKLSVFYALFSLLPFGSLDGTKVFFGSRIIWVTLVIITIVCLGFVYLPQ